MNKAFIRIMILSAVFVALFVLVPQNKTEACSYGGCSDYYTSYDYGSCGYSNCNSYSYTQPYQYFQYPQITYVPNQATNNTVTQPYQYFQYPNITYVPNQNSSSNNAVQPLQYFQYPQIVYVPNQQSSNYNTSGYNTTPYPTSIYSQAGVGQYVPNNGYPYQYQNQYSNQYQYSNQWQSGSFGTPYNNGVIGNGMFVRTN